jgi:hypothetical protein
MLGNHIYFQTKQWCHCFVDSRDGSLVLSQLANVYKLVEADVKKQGGTKSYQTLLAAADLTWGEAFNLHVRP